MSFTHSNALNRFGTTPLIVATDPANGSHTTLASALAVATSGQTVFLRDSVIENVTLTPGVNICAWQGSSASTSSIQGKITMTGAGTSTISGIRLVTNGDNFLAVTGSAASVVNLNNCYLDCADASGITFSSSSGSSALNITNCKGNLGTTGIALFSNSSAGSLATSGLFMSNSGGSSTANTCSAGNTNIVFSSMTNPTTSSGTAACSAAYSGCDTSGQNVTAFTLGGSGPQFYKHCNIISGTASAVSIGTSALLEFCDINSTNTNAVSGSGTVSYSNLVFTNSSNTINTTTQTALITRFGINQSTLQPAFLAEAATQSNVSGDGTSYVLLWTGTEVFDQNGDFASSIFTAPVTGRYQFNLTLLCNGVTSAHTGTVQNFVTSNRSTYYAWKGPASDTANVASFGFSTLTDMDAGDTATIQFIISGSTKTCSINSNSKFSGNLVC